jgi:hypothetical protein
MARSDPGLLLSAFRGETAWPTRGVRTGLSVPLEQLSDNHFQPRFLGHSRRSIQQTQEARKTGGKPGKIGGLEGVISLPFGPLFGMVHHLSLGADSGSPKHKKTGDFGPLLAPEKRVS